MEGWFHTSLLEITDCNIIVFWSAWRHNIELLSLGKFQVFLMPNFALEDPEIFNSVLPWSMVTQEPAESTRAVPRNSAKLLQEKVVITVLNI